MKYNYAIENGEVFSRNEIGEFLWRGSFDNCPASKIIPIPQENDCLVLIDVSSSNQPTVRNLIRINYRGNIVWHATLSQSHDAYVDFDLTAKGVEAWTWSGLHVLVDLQTGIAHQLSFSK